ncbi:hypothetical protein TNCV_2673481 [Trichonephila clavipes]|nr:hypothetical protein TNCV_2673481 [Trichonephila clavipes]
MGPKKTLEQIKYSFFWEGLRADVKKFCESCKECQLTLSVRIKDRSSSTPVARPELPFEVLRMLEQFVVSRIVDIDILMQIWKNRVKQINFVLEWVRWVGSEIISAKGKLEPWESFYCGLNMDLVNSLSIHS